MGANFNLPLYLFRKVIVISYTLLTYVLVLEDFLNTFYGEENGMPKVLDLH